MSADSWAACPKCKTFEEQEEAEEAGGGSVREDYEIGIWKGEFFIHYTAECRDCGFTKSFHHAEDLGEKE